MGDKIDINSKYFIPRYFSISAVILQILIGGFRYSDGSILRAINQGLDINAPIFQNNPYSQYIWESPLKIFLLKIFPSTSFLNLGIIFSILAFLPLVGLAWDKKTRFYRLSSILIVTTTAFKISIQNIGTGDGLIFFLSLLLILSFKNTILSLLSIFLIGLWHPGQAPFIAFSACIACFAQKDYLQNLKKSGYEFNEKINLRAYSGFVIFGLLFSRLILIIYNNLLGFDYINRFDYISDRGLDLLKNNFIYSPIGIFLPLVFMVILFFIKNIFTKSIKFLLISWIFICSFISLLTLDVSRVNILLLTPIFLIIIEKFNLNKSFFLFQNYLKVFSFPVFYILIAVVLLPAWGWSGLEFSMWGDFFNDMCKYRVLCVS